MSEKLISVIVPVYNVEKYIKKTLESLLNQTYENIEIVLVDDGSTDSSSQICDEYAKKDNRIKVIHKENGGLSSARNKGIEIASGDYVFYLDSDDTIDEKCLEILEEALERTESDVAICKIDRVDVNGQKVRDDFPINEEDILFRYETVEKIVKGELPNFAWGKLYRKEVLHGIRFPVGRNYEDRYVAAEIMSNSKQTVLCPKAIMYYRDNPKSIMNKYNIKNVYDSLYADKHVIRFCKINYPELVKDAESIYFGRYINRWLEVYENATAEQIAKYVRRMKSVYREYHNCKHIKLHHKIRYRIIFSMPKIARKVERFARKK